MDREGLPLDPLPSEEAILDAMSEGLWFRAQQVARALDVRGSRRLGTRASKGNWSGGMKAGIRLSPRLRSMAKRGLIEMRWDDSYGDIREFRRRTT